MPNVPQPARFRPSPLPNRVTPFGDIVAVRERGTLMGNRGRLHEGWRIARPWALKRWIACELEFKGRHREVMAPGRYTALFFLDEPTALAAGHRPCFECRRDDARRFVAAWHAGNPGRVPPDASVDALDAALHGERVGGVGHWALGVGPSVPGSIAELPAGTFVAFADAPTDAWLVFAGALHRWSPRGYGERRSFAAARAAARLLTPPSIVNALAAGYRPRPPFAFA